LFINTIKIVDAFLRKPYLVDEIYGLCYTTDMEKIKEYEKWIEQHPIKQNALKRKRSRCIYKGKIRQF